MDKEHFLHYFLAICLVVMLLVCAFLALPGQNPTVEYSVPATTAQTTAQSPHETTAPVQTTVPEQTQPAPTQPQVLQLVQWPESIAAGAAATVTVRGLPETQYIIEVYYKAGVSQAKGLEPQVSDGDGFVSWSWKVSKNVSPGAYRIVVIGGGERVEAEFSVTEPEETGEK